MQRFRLPILICAIAGLLAIGSQFLPNAYGQAQPSGLTVTIGATSVDSTLVPAAQFIEHHVDWESSDSTGGLVFEKAQIVTASKAPRTWSTMLPPFFGMLRVQAITRYSNGTMAESFTVNKPIPSNKPEGEFRAGWTSQGYGIAVSRPAAITVTDQLIRWSYGSNDGTPPIYTSTAPGRTLVFPKAVKGNLLVVASGMSGTNTNWFLSYELNVPASRNLTYMPIIVRGKDQPTSTPLPTASPTNLPIPTATPTHGPAPTATPINTPVPPSCPVGTPGLPSPAICPILSWDSAESLVRINLNGHPAGSSWIWYLKEATWSDWAVTEPQAPYTLLSLDNLGAGKYTTTIIGRNSSQQQIWFATLGFVKTSPAGSASNIQIQSIQIVTIEKPN